MRMSCGPLYTAQLVMSRKIEAGRLEQAPACCRKWLQASENGIDLEMQVQHLLSLGGPSFPCPPTHPASNSSTSAEYQQA